MKENRCEMRLKNFIKSIIGRVLLTAVLSVALSMFVKVGAHAYEVNASAIPTDADYHLTGDTTVIIDQNVDLGNHDIYLEGHNLTIMDTNNTGGTLKFHWISDNYQPYGNVTVSSGKIEMGGVGTCQNFTMTGGSIVATSSINAFDSVTISGGTIKSGGRLLGRYSVTITDGTIDFNCNFSSGIGSEGNINITGGNVTAISTRYYGINAFEDGATVTIGNNAYVKAQGLYGAIVAKDGITINGENVGQLENSDMSYHYGGKSIEINAPSNTNAAVSKPSVTNTSSHTHSFTWQVSKYPTSTSDGEEAYQCSCGEIAQINILPAISAFEEETINKIKSAPANGVVNIETKLFNSFGIGVRDALAAKPDVTLKVSFLSEGYKGEHLKVTIPAGTDVKTLWDDKGWLGLCRAGSTLGYDKTEQ